MDVTNDFDLDAYLKRIGSTGGTLPTLETLRDLHLRHPLTIPFENLNPLMGWTVSLRLTDIQQKILVDKRGGYCYEQNSLFQQALRACGFQVTGLAARVAWNTPEGVVPPRTHMLLRVDVAGERFIADVGFGGLTLTAPLRLQPGIEQITPHEIFRLMQCDDELALEVKLGGVWRSLYRFTLQEQLLPDYEMANYYVSSHPRSRFVNNLIAARAETDCRYTLWNNEFSVHHRSGRTERQTLDSIDLVRKILRDPIGIELPESADLDRALVRLASSFGKPAGNQEQT